MFIWTIGWDVYALTHAPLAIFDANIFFPNANTLAYSEHLLGTLFIAAPVVWLTGNPLLGANLVALCSVFLCAAGGYVLGRKLGMSPHAAFICGVVFAFVPPRFGRIYQLHLTTIYWVPFGIGFLHAYLRDSRARDLRWAAAFFTLQAVTSGHGAALLALGYVILLAHHVASGGAVRLTTRLRDMGLTGALLLLPAILTLIPYWRARNEVGLVRLLPAAGITPSSWVASSAHAQQYLLSRLPDWQWLRTEPDLILFPGFLVLLLAAIALRTPRAARVWIVMLIVPALMTLGPPYGIWQWIYRVPGLSFIRVPSRFMLLGMLALSALAALGFERLLSRLPSRRHLAATALAALLLCAEFATMPIDVRPLTVAAAPIDRWLNVLPKPFSVAEFPVPQSSFRVLVVRRHAEYMLHSMAHFQPIVQGFSGIDPPGFEQLERTLMTFPDEPSIDALARLKVTYAVVHMDLYAPDSREDARVNLERFQREGALRLIHTEGEGRVYQIVGRRP